MRGMWILFSNLISVEPVRVFTGDVQEVMFCELLGISYDIMIIFLNDQLLRAKMYLNINCIKFILMQAVCRDYWLHG